jgi:hypothetical protein
MTEHLDSNDVVSMDANQNLLSAQTFKVSQLTRGLSQRFSSSVVTSHWLEEGVECEVLRVGEKWCKGRIRIQLELNFEFVPDEAEQPNTGNQEENLL